MRCHLSIENIKSIVNGDLFKNVCDYLTKVDRCMQMQFTMVFIKYEIFQISGKCISWHLPYSNLVEYIAFFNQSIVKKQVCTIFLDLYHMLFAHIPWMFDFICCITIESYCSEKIFWWEQTDFHCAFLKNTNNFSGCNEIVSCVILQT